MQWIGITQDEIDNGGRIHKDAYVITLSFFFVAGWVAAAIRFYVRIGIQRRLSLDDGFLIVGLSCQTAAYALLLRNVVNFFTAAAYLGPNGTSLALQSGFLDLTFYSVRVMDIILILSWCAISCVKLSFLFLFRKLIDRMRYMVIYWWIVLVYVLAVAGYGGAVYVLVCPNHYDLRALQCMQGAGLQRITNYSLSSISLDIVGDCLILLIPIHIIWKVKIGIQQKLALAASLCLTVVVIAITITKVAGMRVGPFQQYDMIWNCYFNAMSAEIGLLMTSATAFRSLYLSRTNANRNKLSNSSERSKLSAWWYRVRSRYRSNRVDHEGKQISADSDWSDVPRKGDRPQIGMSVLPRGRQETESADPYQSRFHMTHIIQGSWEELDEEMALRKAPQAMIR